MKKLNLNKKKLIIMIIFILGLIVLLYNIIHIVGTFYYHEKDTFTNNEISVIENEFSIKINDDCRIVKAFNKYNDYGGIILKLNSKNYSDILTDNLNLNNCEAIFNQIYNNNFIRNYKLYNDKEISAIIVQRVDYTENYKSDREETVAFYKDNDNIYVEIKALNCGVDFEGLQFNFFWV